jgi:uncharacterized iron-regulated protein
MLLLAGCATTPRSETAKAADIDVRRDLVIVDGADGAPMTWEALLATIDHSDVIFIGEQHNDAVGHAAQLAVYEDTVSRHPGTALSLEMLERDEQDLLEDYLDELIDQRTFERLTFSSSWGGDGGWIAWYQPIVDVAREAGAPVVAANAPRRYVRIARKEGYEPLDELPASRRALFDLPDATPSDTYRQRFYETMSSFGDEEHADEGPDEEAIAEMFRSQLVWDETMGLSAAGALQAGAPKVVHLIGQFHSDFDGGTVQAAQRRVPNARILVISMQPVEATTLRDEDDGRADVVIFTGSR